MWHGATSDVAHMRGGSAQIMIFSLESGNEFDGCQTNNNWSPTGDRNYLMLMYFSDDRFFRSITS
jgi:hypothetical protein